MPKGRTTWWQDNRCLVPTRIPCSPNAVVFVKNDESRFGMYVKIELSCIDARYTYCKSWSQFESTIKWLKGSFQPAPMTIASYL